MLDKPEIVKLVDGGDKQQKKETVTADNHFDDNEYKAIDVACGPSFVFCVAHSAFNKDASVHISYEDKESESLAKKIAAELKKEGDLVSFFKLHETTNEERLALEKKSGIYKSRRKSTKKSKKSAEAAGADEGKNENEMLKEGLKRMSPYQIHVNKERFADCMSIYEKNRPNLNMLY